MATVSATADDLDALSVVLTHWCEEAQRWEERLAHRAAEASYALYAYRSCLERQRAALRTRAREFRIADTRRYLSTRSTTVRASLQRAAGSARSAKRADDLRCLAKHTERTYLRATNRGDGQVVEILGDLANAEHIVVLVPGMTNELSNYEADLRKKAVNFLDEMRRQSPNAKVALVAWLGYDTPDLNPRGIVQARESREAKKGEKSLRSDLVEIRRLNPKAAITAVGHSYGSVVLGQAMRHDLDKAGVSDVVVVGSPGMDADDRSDLGSPKTTVWASKASVRIRPKIPFPFPLPLPIFPGPETLPLDPVSFAPAHGEDPSAKGFGAKKFSSKGTKKHGDYFLPKSESLKNMAKIALGSGVKVSK